MVYSDATLAFTDLDVEIDQINKNEIENFDVIPLFQVDSIITMNDSLTNDNKEIELLAASNDLGDKTPDSLTGGHIMQNSLESASFKNQVSLRLSTFKVKNAIKISTALDGYNSGREYLFLTESADKCIEISNHLSRISKAARDQFAFNTKWNRAQERMRIAYSSNLVQGFVGALIILVSP
jgi:hypothetical protein